MVQFQYQDYHKKKYLIIGLFTIVTVITFSFIHLFLYLPLSLPYMWLCLLVLYILHLVDMYVGRFKCCTQFLRKKLRTLHCVSLREKEREWRRHLLRGAILICVLRIGKDLAYTEARKNCLYAYIIHKIKTNTFFLKNFGFLFSIGILYIS